MKVRLIIEKTVSMSSPTPSRGQVGGHTELFRVVLLACQIRRILNLAGVPQRPSLFGGVMKQ